MLPPPTIRRFDVLAGPETPPGEVLAGAQGRGRRREFGEHYPVPRCVQRVPHLEEGIHVRPTQADVERLFDRSCAPLVPRGVRFLGRGAPGRPPPCGRHRPIGGPGEITRFVLPGAMGVPDPRPPNRTPCPCRQGGPASVRPRRAAVPLADPRSGRRPENGPSAKVGATATRVETGTVISRRSRGRPCRPQAPPRAPPLYAPRNDGLSVSLGRPASGSVSC